MGVEEGAIYAQVDIQNVKYLRAIYPIAKIDQKKERVDDKDISSLLQLYLPIGKGTFDITGDIHLVYDTDEGEAMFDIAHSTAKNFTSKKE